MPAPAIVISATFTADALEPALAFWMRELDFDYRIQFAPYNQVFQQLLDPASPRPREHRAARGTGHVLG